ncbi:MAG: hypothetical protein FWC71_07600 [Defluviitaleaceae bacterium]|nr:hypothetical protein [Defluviitaleaceae bacterium]
MEHKHETKVALYGADGGRMGETFSRRARQLVKQQRATWMNAEHTAIQFVADEPEAWDAEPAVYAPHEAHTPEAPDAALLELAQKRLSTRRWFFLHALALIPGYAFWAAISSAMFWRSGSNQFDYGFALGVTLTLWTVSFVVSFFRFKKYNRGYFPFAFTENRRDRKLAEEVERLRRMGYGK